MLSSIKSLRGQFSGNLATAGKAGTAPRYLKSLPFGKYGETE
jgi:hypothetical protein